MINSRKTLKYILLLSLVLCGCGGNKAEDVPSAPDITAAITITPASEDTVTAVPTSVPSTAEVTIAPTSAPTLTPADAGTATAAPTSTAEATAAPSAATATPAPSKQIVTAPKQAEALDRGFIAIMQGEDIFLSWRFLGTDNDGLAFNLYYEEQLLNESPIKDATCFTVSVEKLKKASALPTKEDLQKGLKLALLAPDTSSVSNAPNASGMPQTANTVETASASNASGTSETSNTAGASGASETSNTADTAGASETANIAGAAGTENRSDLSYTESSSFIGVSYVIEGEYLSIPVKQYEKGDYDINDASVGDLDGDGEYEIVVRREPANMDYRSRVAYPLIEAYKLDGTHLWTIDIGPNEINPVDINFIVYDMNGDGKAEVIMRSFEGTTDGTGIQLPDLNGDGITNYATAKNKIVIMKDRSYLQEPPEYLSMYEGATGKEIARTELLPVRDPLSSWYAGSDEGKQVKRASHYLFAVAYLNGETPSFVHFRGAWATCKVAAYDIVDNQFVLRWLADCENKETLDNLYNTGYHSIAVADVDFDGKDEIITGAAAVDDDGTIMYTVKGTRGDGKEIKLGHGDAFDVARMSPDDENFYVWACRETPNLSSNIGLHDALTGEVIFGQTKGKDTGRSRAADIDPTSPGWEMWGSTGTPLFAFDGTVLNETCPSPMNMKMYWDGDLLAELVDHDANREMNIYKWDWEKKKLNTLLTAKGSASNGGTKGQTCLIADIFGDWREELVVRTGDNKEMRIYSTAIPTEYRIYTLMHDITYREAVAWQNNHYNQPANTGFYFGAETAEFPKPNISTK